MRGVGDFELLGRNQTIDTNLYCHQPDRIQEKLVQTRPRLVNRKGVLFHQDNARPHVSRVALGKISELNWELIPYLPDLAPSDFHLFRSLQNFLDGQKFGSLNAVQIGLQNFLAPRTRSSTEGELKTSFTDGARSLERSDSGALGFLQ